MGLVISSKYFLACLLALLFWAPAQAAILADPESFIAEAFPNSEVAPETLWLTGQELEAAKDILGRTPPFRIHYWREGKRTAWILEQIGKYQPITAGFVINDGAIETVQVLIYRESHGWEVKYPFFTDQFIGARLEEMQLDKNIDGIAGATLSVRALVQMARLALTLHESALHE